MVDPDRDPPGVRADVVDPVGVGLSQGGVDEVVDLDRDRRPGR